MHRTVAVLVVLALVAGCGGGSSSGPATPELEYDPPPPPPDLSWLQQAGGTGACWGVDLATAPGGDVLLTGALDDTATFGLGQPNETTLVATGLQDGFLAKYDEDGMLLWTTAIEGEQVISQSVAVSPNGAVSVVGFFFDEVTFDPGGPNQTTLMVSPGDATDGYEDGFLAHYAADGSLAWVRHFQAEYETEGLGVSARPDNTIVVCGLYGWDMVLGAGEPEQTTLIPSGFLEGFLAAYAANGDLLWAETTTSHPDAVTTLWSVSTDGDGAIVAAGEYDLTATVGTQLLASNADSQDIHLSRWAPDGAFQWARSIGGPNTDQMFGLGLAPDGTIRIAGSFWDTSSFGFLNGQPVTLTSFGVADGYVASYTATGSVLWAAQIGGAGSDYIYDAYVDPDGGLHVIGYFQGEATFGAGQPGAVTLQSSGAGDAEAFVAGFGSFGDLGWARRFGGIANDYGQGITGFGDGDVVITGSFEGDATLGDDPTVIPGLGDRSAFFVRTTAE